MSPIKKEEPQKQKVENTAPDLNLICQNLVKEMKGISAKRTTFALEQINQDIRLCLPMMPFAQQKKLMQLSDQMYTQFLSIDRTQEQQKAFEHYALDQSQFPTIQQTHFEKLHSRDQYLLRHKGQAYIELSENHDGEIVYRRNPQYLSKVFAPYFPEAEKVFMQELANQNQDFIFTNRNINILPQEMVRRALFWENYNKKYPKSSFKEDAKSLSNFYTSLLFFGSPKSQVSDLYNGELDIQISHFMEIEALAKQKNSLLANQARLFLNFIDLTPDQRIATIHLPAKLYYSVANNPHQLAMTQLSQYLQVKNFDFAQSKRKDCLSDAVCH